MEALFGLAAITSEPLKHSILYTPLNQRFFKHHHPVVFLRKLARLSVKLRALYEILQISLTEVNGLMTCN